jgi:hypothetical protein
LPFPFTYLPTFAELKFILVREYGCEFKSDMVLVDELNDSYPLTYFERTVEGEVLDFAIVIPADEEERIAPSFLRSICVRLKIPLVRFHLEAGPSSWED